MGKRGFWDNIHAKRNRGESPAKPGDEGYPTDKALKESAAKKQKHNHASSMAPFKRCWKGYKAVPGKKAYSPGSCKKA